MPENIRKKRGFLEILTKEEKKTLKTKKYENGLKTKTGYIEMEVNPANRREKIISLTETGKQYARELVLPLFQSEEEAAAQFTEQEMTEVIRMQEKFADALAKSMEEKVIHSSKICPLRDMITAEFEKERKRMKEELKKSLRTYGALLLLGVTGVPLGAAVGLIEALFCRLLLKVTAVRLAHLFWCLPFLAMAGLVIVAVNQKFGGRGKGGMSLIFDVAYEEETELPLRMIPLAMLSTALTHLFGGSAGREGVAVQIGAVFSYFAGKNYRLKTRPVSFW